MFKSSWEKTSIAHPLPKSRVHNMLCLAYPKARIAHCSLMDGGCANLNYKIQLANREQPLVLRVYVRNQDAGHREQVLAELLKPKVPVPLIYYRGEYHDYHFAITEFIPGIELRKLLLSNTAYDMRAILHAVGAMLSKIATHPFPKTDRSSKQLDVILDKPLDSVRWAEECLIHDSVLSVLSAGMVADIKQIFKQYRLLLPTHNEKYLVHGDFDPANILVNKINGSWVIRGVLDWEFAFSGSYLWDIASMLRYTHKMKAEFQDSFIEGLQKGGIQLPSTWHITIQLLNLLSLLDCLKRSHPKREPTRCLDIHTLIAYILRYLKP